MYLGLLFFGIFLYPLHTHALAARYLQEASHSARGKGCCGLDIDPYVVAHLILGLSRALIRSLEGEKRTSSPCHFQLSEDITFT